MKILGNLGNFFSKNKKNIVYTLAFLVFLFCFNDFAFAAEPEKKPDQVIQALNGILGILGSLLGLLTMLVGLFLRPEWTSGSVIGLDTQLKVMWILISNIVYFIFAGIFITIAFMNIVGGGDNYELKKAIPKFIVGVLIVPFSWFFVQFILSLSSILTVAVLSLPFDTFPNLKIDERKINVCEFGNRINLSNTGSNFMTCTKKDGSPEAVGDGKIPKTIGEFIKEKDNGGLYSIMTIYTYGVMKLDDKGILYSGELSKGITSVWSLGLKTIFDLVFIVVYALLMIALFLAFMVRGFALWFYVMFSPVFGLLYYLGKGKEGVGEGAAKSFNLHEFIALAFVPVYVAGALSFGLLFLFVAGKGFSENTTQNALIKFEGDKLTIGNNTFTSDAIKTENDKAGGDLFKGFTGPVGAMVLELLGLAVMWIAVMAALKSSKITGDVTGPIAEFGKQVGELIKKSPTYAPILPGGLSVAGLPAASSAANTFYSNKANTKMTDFLEKKGIFSNEDIKKDQEAERNVKNFTGLQSQAVQMDNHLRTFRDTKDIANGDGSIAELSKLLGHYLKDDAKKYEGKLKNDPTMVAKALAELSNNQQYRSDTKSPTMTETKINNGTEYFIKSDGTKTTEAQTGEATTNANVSKTPDENGSGGVTVHIKDYDNPKADPKDIIIQTKNFSKDNIKDLADGFKDKNFEKKLTKKQFEDLLSELGISKGDDREKVINKLGEDFFKSETK